MYAGADSHILHPNGLYHQQPYEALPAQQNLIGLRSFTLLTVIFIIISFPSPTHSFIPGLKPTFSANPSHRSLSFSSSGLTTWIPQTFAVTSDHLFLLVSFSALHF